MFFKTCEVGVPVVYTKSKTKPENHKEKLKTRSGLATQHSYKDSEETLQLRRENKQKKP